MCWPEHCYNVLTKLYVGHKPVIIHFVNFMLSRTIIMYFLNYMLARTML